jgi:glycosidase
MLVWGIERNLAPHRFRVPWPVRGPARAFHVSLDARRRYDLDEAWVTLRGDLLLADPDRTAQVASRVARDPDPDVPPLRAADLYAGALLEEVYHLVIERYLRTVDSGLFTDVEVRARAWLGDRFDAVLRGFVQRYPPPDVAVGSPPESALTRQVDGVPGLHVALEEAWTCYLANVNPALAGAKPLVDVTPLAAVVPFDALIDALRGHLADRPGLPGRRQVSLFDVLLEPSRAHPNDLAAQLRFVREAWGALLGEKFQALLGRFLEALAAVREADVARGGGVPGPPPPPSRADLRAGEDEPERFSPDGDWMPRVVMVAKSVYVWLDQLGRDHGSPVERLDEIPDAALAELSARGINALWLIGLWQRSDASRKIKRLRGQPDAEASAYALYDYVIAHELGGETAYEVLKARAARHGLRLATDMVPNHVGVDGRWVVEHPERFVQLPHPPYPGYTFGGPDLSSDPRVEIRIEDHYYDGTDAAVVFERRDRASGEVAYVYHGNDGTTMPWNDTAQLDYLRADVREAVLRTIVGVARRSPIIRFDAAMTLAKRHVRRLWYPAPGEAGGVPSRGRFGAMSDEDFEAAMGAAGGGEFWREVVERVAREAPDTLLLAEAFWMMESYFVRTLGMHRVYNSAFMHMLRDGDNAGYRRIVKELLVFDPRVLQRYVNFMNNPDEETARDQFGDGDRYFAVATLLATLPGLPMFGHGQFEGYREKYGMEYRRAKLDERPEAWLVERHERELVPVLRGRATFAEAEAFRLFDATENGGATLEDVYAFTNATAKTNAGALTNASRSLVIVNHRYERSVGLLQTSVPFVPQAGENPRTVELGEALGLQGGEGRFVVARDLTRAVTVVRSADEVRREGWSFDLDGYARRVYVDVHERKDPDGSLARVAAEFGDAGVASLDEALDDLRWGTAYRALDAAVDALMSPDGDDDLAERWRLFVESLSAPLGASWASVAAAPPASPTRAATVRLIEAFGPVAVATAAYAYLVGTLPDAPGVWRRARLGRPVARRLSRAGRHDGEMWAATAAAAIATVAIDGRPPTPARAVVAWSNDADARRALAVHEHGDVTWYRSEGIDALADVSAILGRLRRPGGGPTRAWTLWRQRLDAWVETSGYRFDALLGRARKVTPVRARRHAPKASGGAGDAVPQDAKTRGTKRADVEETAAAEPAPKERSARAKRKADTEEPVARKPSPERRRRKRRDTD